ncbi:polysaccharide pyruvyl transferase family protein [Agromyces atrinae]|nr:polysaccharide pyruvyl transferase family protein [Agromyces atrinae]NYD68508.1 polysaccharide pyruvyl transferase WcaK-like protein [Agromyces atrinae]
MNDVSPRVLILWANAHSANLGVRALAQGSAELVRQVWPDAAITFQDLGPNEEGFRVSMQLVKADIGRPQGPIKRWLRSFDLVVDTGAGDSFADIYGRNRLGRIIYTQLTASSLGLPVVLGPQTIGPFDGFLSRLVARFALSKASSTFARDSASLDYAKSLGARRLLPSTDVVFGLQIPDAGPARDVLLNVSGLLWQENSHVDASRYQESVRSLITQLDASGRRVSLLAHVIDNPTKDNDLIAMRELEGEFGDRVKSVVPNSLDEVRSALRGANIVIGSRMHACLNALSVGTPAIPWAYSRKFAPLLRDLGWPISIDLKTEQRPQEQTLALVARDASTWDAYLAALREAADDRLSNVTDALRALGSTLVREGV